MSVSRCVPYAVLYERERLAVKLREACIPDRKAATQRELSTHTVVEAHKAYRRGGWSAVKVRHGSRPSVRAVN